ncbi:MAG TPA: sugar ABC transporter substrate-binding protein [Candidatus Limnocylindrales bacterium]|nr:sugar ABC transporter substrate-binding protein [Candidatus Limnocylindrales bacterium]
MGLNRMGRLAGGLLATLVIVGACSSGGGGASPASQAPASQGGGGGEDITIGVTFPILDQFLQTVADGMEAKAAEIGNVTLNIVAAEEQTDTQLGQVENFISQGVDAIIVIPVDTDATGPMTEAAQKAGIPLVYVNRRPADLPSGIPYVGSDSLYAGTVEMQALADLAGNKGNVVILIGDPANEAAVLRTKGCKDVAAERGMPVIKEQAGNWYRDQGLEIMENWLQSGDQIDVVCANNDEMALGAIEALKNANKLDEVLVGGVDATADALAAMAAGELEVTVFQDANGQGGGGVEAAVKLVNGESVPDLIDIPYQLVTPENMADFQ